MQTKLSERDRDTCLSESEIQVRRFLDIEPALTLEIELLGFQVVTNFKLLGAK